MQANKLSAYNTQITPTHKKVEIVKGKPNLRSVAVNRGLDSKVKQCESNAHSGNFDFAGLAG